MQKRPEPTQGGNPHRLVVRQHVFPKASITRFVGSDGRVDFVNGRRKTAHRTKPGDQLFCARRAWDQRAETGYMKSIEDRFQELARAVVQDGGHVFDTPENASVSEFYALWHYRSRQRELPDEFLKMHAVTGNQLSKDQHEILEKKGVMAAREDGTIAARHINGAQMQMLIARYASNELGAAEWGVVVSQDGEFCVPDVPEHGIIPITPSVCLVKDSASGMVIRSNVAEINRAFISMSRDYFFARDVGLCPGAPPEIAGWSS